MGSPVYESGNRKNFTATTTVVTTSETTGVCNHLLGVFVASSSSGTLKFADSVGTIVNTFSATAATFYPIPSDFNGTLTITVGGTIDATVFWMN